MIYVGIDISKYKHDCFICKDTGEVIVENLSFTNNKKGFQQFLDLLKPYDNFNVHIGLEATGHYGLNLKLFLEKNNYSFMEFNPLLVKEFYKSLSFFSIKKHPRIINLIEMFIYLIDPFYLYFLSYNNSCLWICRSHPTALTV